MIVLIIVLSIIVLMTILLFLPLYINIRYVYSEKSGKTQISLKYLWFKIDLVPRKKKSKSKKKEKTDTEDNKKSISADTVKGYINTVSAVWDDICKILDILIRKAVNIKELSIYSKFGFDDPMLTGLVTGAANAFIYNMVSVIDTQSNLERRNISLNPDFDNPQLSVRIHSIIKIKNVHIIVIVIKLIKIFYKIK